MKEYSIYTCYHDLGLDFEIFIIWSPFEEQVDIANHLLHITFLFMQYPIIATSMF